MRPLLRSLAIALPLIGLGYSWQATRQAAAQGVEWDVPVSGYDPRDLLRGHYVQFQYSWPEDPLATMGDEHGKATKLCLEGEAPVIRRATAMGDQDDTRDCQGLAHAPGQGSGSGQPTIVPRIGRLFVPQTDASRLERALADPGQQAILRFRLRPDGSLVPLRLSFAPKPKTSATPTADQLSPP